MHVYILQSEHGNWNKNKNQPQFPMAQQDRDHPDLIVSKIQHQLSHLGIQQAAIGVVCCLSNSAELNFY